MSSVLPGRHPDDDALADLAAEVLPDSEARVIEAHVIGCPRCADLLADAERLRRLLVAEDPGPMPMDVLARIESALQAEASARAAGSSAATAPAPRSGAWDDAPSSGRPPPGSPSGSSPGGDGWVDDEPTPWDDPESWNRGHRGGPDHGAGAAFASGPPSGRGGRSRPGGRSTSTSRRDLRESTRPGASGRGRWLASAAGIALIAGLGGLAVVNGMNVGVGANSTSASLAEGSARAQAAAESAIEGVPYYSTRTPYSANRFAAQVQGLLQSLPGATKGVSSGSTGDVTQVPAAPSSDGELPGTAATPPRDRAVAAAALRNPQRLAQCLVALGQAGTRPVAIDFARYEGREAAVIVLPGRTGGYEAWAVDPTCGPEGDGLLAVKQIPPS